MRHSARARSALAQLPDIDPAIAALAIWCTYRDHETRTCTEGETIYLGPEFGRLSMPEQIGLLAHHVLHVALRHSARRSAARERYGQNFVSKRYDLACDALVNEVLLQGGHALPRPAVRAEEIVARLPADARPENALTDWDSERLYLAMMSEASDGSKADSAIEAYAAEMGFEPDLNGADPDASNAELWSGRLDQAISAGRLAGSGIGTTLVNFGDLPKGRVLWEILLRRVLVKALTQYPQASYHRPSRTWLAQDALARQSGGTQPAFEPGSSLKLNRTRIVIGLDTSSSIAKATLDLFAAEASSIVRRTGAEAYLLGFDTEVHSRVRFERAETIASMKLRRDGGTNFDTVLTEAATLDPSITVILTDGEGPVAIVPTCPLLWALPRAPSKRPPVGEVLIFD